MIFQKTLRLRAACLFAAALLSIAPVAAASPEAAPRWVRATPFGGEITSLAQAPSAPRMLYAFAYNGRVFRSLDGGATWNRRGEALAAGFPKNVIVDSGDPQTVYAAMQDYTALRSRDGGATWTQIASEVGTIFQLAADRYHPGVLFAAADGLYRSDDGGDSWARVAFEGATVIGVAVDPRAADTVVAVTEGNDFYGEADLFWKSTDHGTTWTSSAFPGSSYSRILELVFDPARPESLYVLFVEFDTTKPVLRSSDGGASWSELPAYGIRGLAAAADGTLFAATSYGLEQSSDGGTTWVPPIEPGYVPPGAPPRDILTEIVVSSAAPGEIFAAGSSGLWKSGDNGASWAISNQGILAQGALQVVAAPTGPPAVFTLAGTSLFRSADQGATWARLHSFLYGPQPSVIEAIDPRHPQTIYGIADGQADFPVVSTNGGRQWSKLEIPYNCDGRDSICDVYLWAVTLDRDGSLFARGSFYFHYVGGGSYLLRSEDGGQTWKDLKRPAGGIGDFAVDPRRRDTYHAVNCAGFFQSTDAGRTWKETGLGLPGNLCGRYGGLLLAINPQDPQRVYITSGKGIFASSDGGATFRAVTRGLETGRVVTLLFDPTDSSKLYAGVAEKGVFRWNAAQRKWTPLNRGLPLAQFAGSIALDPRHPSLLYAASPVEGVYRLDLEEPAP